MLPVGKKCSHISGVSEFIAKITFHVNRRPAQVTAPDKCPHVSCRMAELTVMSYCQLEPPLDRKRHEHAGLLGVEREWLLHIDVASPFQAKLGYIEMALRRRRDVNNIGCGVTQEFCQVAKVPF